MLKNKIEKVKSEIINLPSPVKASIAFTIGSFLQQGVNLITVPIFTRILKEETYGIVSVYNSWLGVLNVIITFSLVGGVINNGMLEFEEDREGFLSSILSLIIGSTGIYYIGYKIFQKNIENVLGFSEILMTLMFMGFILNSATGLWMVKERYLYKWKLVIVINFVTAIISPIISYVFIVRIPSNQVLARISGGVVIPFVIGIIIAVYLLIQGKKTIDFKYWKYALKFNIPLIPHYLSYIVLAQSDRIMISKFDGDARAGIYSLAYSVAMIITILFSSINSSFIPWTYKKMKEESYKEIGEQSNRLLILTTVCSLLFVLFAPELIRIMAPPSYHEAVYIIPAVVMGNYFMFVFTLFGNIEFYHKKTKYIMMGSVTAAILNIVLNLIFIPIYGYIAAGYTTMVGYLGLCFIHYYFMKKIEKNEIYDMKYIIGISSLLTFVSFVSLTLYELLIVRYMVICFIITGIYFFRKYLINILKKNKK